MNNFQYKLKTAVDTLVGHNSSWLQRRDSVHDLHRLFTGLGAMNSIAELLDLADHLQTASGRAIAPRQAGLCLLEVQRTRVFVQALIDAINDLLLHFPGQTITVLDAGCGPYALLPLLAALYFTPQQVQFTVLDIHPANLNSAQKLVTALDMQAYFAGFIEADATAWQWPGSTGPDIVISETMNRGLQKEPQVAITLNLAAQLPPHGILLPQQVAVSLGISRFKVPNTTFSIITEGLPASTRPVCVLAELMALNRYSTHAAITRRPLKTLSIPHAYQHEAHNLQLFTHITAYKHHYLEWFNCSLTLPLPLQRIREKTIRAGDVLDFYYSLNGMPGIEFEKREPQN